MSTTEAQKRACKRYQKTLAQITIRLKHDDLERYKAAAAAAGMSFRAFLLAGLEKMCYNK